MKNEFLEGLKDGFPIFLGYFSISMAFGLTVSENGMPGWAAVLMSSTNYTSAGQFAVSEMMIEHATMIEIAVSTIIINLRYFLMSISLSQKLSPEFNLVKRLIVSFGVTDEIFAIDMQKKSLNFSYMLGVMLIATCGWSLGTAVGAFGNNLLDESISSMIGIAMYIMFIAIIIPPTKESRNIRICVIASAIISLVFSFLPILRDLPSGWVLIGLTLLISSLMAYLLPIKEIDNE